MKKSRIQSSRLEPDQEVYMKSNDAPKREEKKKPQKSLKEKRAEKKSKKDSKSSE